MSLVCKDVQESVPGETVSQFIPLLFGADARCPLAVHVRSTAEGPHRVKEGVSHRFTGFYFLHEAQTLVDI